MKSLKINGGYKPYINNFNTLETKEEMTLDNQGNLPILNYNHTINKKLTEIINNTEKKEEKDELKEKNLIQNNKTINKRRAGKKREI